MTTEYTKPLPRREMPSLTQFFWDAAKRHELVMTRCKKCEKFFFFPREVCPTCLLPQVEWAPVSGRGRIHSYTVVHQPEDPAFREDAPYVFAIIQTDEGFRMPTRLIDVSWEDFQKENKIGTRVVAVFEDVTPEWTLVRWKPA